MNIGVIIGRFQVPALTPGHLGLINHVWSRNDRVVVLLGVSPIDGNAPEYPLSYEQRSTLFWNLQGRTEHFSVHPLFDRKCDTEWSRALEDFLFSLYPTDHLTLYAGRDSGFVGHYKGEIPVESVVLEPELPGESISGTSVRTSLIESYSTDFLKGQTFSLNKQFPKVHPTVDVALVTSRGPAQDYELFLIKRADTGEWCLPGGFVDPTDTSLEKAAQRELHEETGLYSETKLTYLGSSLINDWRYRGSRDKILSSLFLGWHVFGNPTIARREVADWTWAPLYTAKVSEAHQPFLELVQSHLEKDR